MLYICKEMSVGTRGTMPSLPLWQEVFLQRQQEFREKCVEPYKDVTRIYETLKDHYIKLQAENKQMRSQVEALKSDLATTSAAYSSSTPAQVTKLQSRLLELQDQLTETLRQQNEGVKSRLALSEANQKLKEEHATISTECARANNSLKGVSEELDRTKTALRDREMQVSTLGEELMRMRSALEMKCKEADGLKQENEGLLGRMMNEKMKGIEQLNSMNNLLESVKKERDRALEAASIQQQRILELTKAVTQLSAPATQHRTAPTNEHVSEQISETTPTSEAGMTSLASFTRGAPEAPPSTSPAGLLSWFGQRVTTAVSAAADKVATLSGTHADVALMPGVATRAGQGVPSFMSQSVAGLVSDYIIASHPLPSRVTATATAHSSEVNCVKFSDSSRLVASGGSDGNVCLIDANTGTKQAVLYTSTEGNAVISLDVHGSTVFGGCTDRTVRVWDLTTQRLTRSLTGHSGKVHSLIFVPQTAATTATSQSMGRGLLWSGGADRMIKLWDLRDGRCVRSIDAKSIVNCISLSTDGMLIACANQDSGVRLYDCRMGSKLAENTASHTSAVTSVMFSRNDGSARLLSGSRDNTLRLLDGKTLEPLRAFLPTASVLGLGTSSHSVAGVLDRFKGPDSSSMEASSAPGTLVMRHPTYRTPINTSRAVLSPSGQYAVAGATNGHIYAWSAETATFEQELGVSKSKPRRRESSHIAADAVKAEPSILDAWEADRNPHDDTAIYGVDWSPDGRFICSGDEKGRVVLWGSE